MASGRRGGRWPAGLLLHSDRGGQYSSARFREELCAHGITASMSRRGNCSDNALAESFFSTRKIELVYRHERRDHSPARQLLFEWIEVFYNRDRRGYIYHPTLRILGRGCVDHQFPINRAPPCSVWFPLCSLPVRPTGLIGSRKSTRKPLPANTASLVMAMPCLSFELQP